jgi:NTP pyrophosphatase (non-canonical NTP hydrolase)
MSNETTATVARWAAETFGPTPNLASVAARANREMAELLQELADDDCSPKIGEEIADVFICLYRLIHLAGVEIDVEIDRKMAINRNRRWNVSANGHGQHVEDTVK